MLTTKTPRITGLHTVSAVRQHEQLDAKALGALQGVLKDNSATWTSQGQRQAVLATLLCKSDVIAILATGAGKTMLALIPSILEPQSATVVIVPLKSLLADYERKLANMHISFEVFSTSNSAQQKLSGQCSLILVLIDQARS